MLKENWRLISRVQRLGDICIIVGSFFLAYYGRGSLLILDALFGWKLPFQGPELAPLKDYFIVLVVSLISYEAILSRLGAYGSMRLSSPGRLLWISVLSSGLVFLILAAALFLLKIDLSRAFIILFCGLVALLLAGERLVVLRLLRFWRKRGMNFRNLLVCGLGAQSRQLVAEIAMRPELGIRIRGFVDLRPVVGTKERQEVLNDIKAFRAELRSGGQDVSGRVLLGVDAVEKALKSLAIDEVIFTDVIEVMPQVREVLEACAEEGVRATIAADLFSRGIVKSGLSFFGGMPLIHFHTPPGDQWELNVKRIVDIVLSAILLIILSPLLLTVALVVRISSPGAVIFRQRRMGLNGRTFTLYKFRSMREGAERELTELKAHNELQGPAFKMADDPRVTPIGKLLRRYSLDELPQLWNVFKGDMSLVGPRPPVPGEVSLYERRDRRRLSMRPGITCTWQVSGRSDIKDFDQWVKLDLDYIDNWSLRRDLALLLKTIPAVFLGRGAR